MDTIGPIAGSATIGGAGAQRSPVQPKTDSGEGRVLDPAVSVEVSPSAKAEEAAERRGFVRDSDSQALVFRVTDAVSGDVIVQIPDEIVIKARAYSRQPEEPQGARVARSV